MGWIKTKDKLPEVGKEVFALSKVYNDKCPFRAIWNGQCWEDVDFSTVLDFREINWEVTHWIDIDLPEGFGE